jgi:DNA polymerase-3 subunit epsilon
MKFTAIDFETANSERYSACAVGLIKTEDHRIVKQDYYLIRPPSPFFHYRNIEVHGLTWDDVKDEKSFEKLWPKIRPYFRGVDFIVAHNASFDRSVLEDCCSFYEIELPKKPFLCTRFMAKKVWRFNSCSLENVCNELGINLKQHHHALHDAMACVHIMKKAHKHIKDDIGNYLYDK